MRKDLLKWLDRGIICPFSDSQRVSSVKIVPKKTSITVIRNNKNELILIQVQSRWGVCTNYRKLNATT